LKKNLLLGAKICRIALLVQRLAAYECLTSDRITMDTPGTRDT